MRISCQPADAVAKQTDDEEVSPDFRGECFAPELCCCPHSSETQGSVDTGSQRGVVAWENENKLNLVGRHSNSPVFENDD